MIQGDSGTGQKVGGKGWGRADSLEVFRAESSVGGEYGGSIVLR